MNDIHQLSQHSSHSQKFLFGMNRKQHLFYSSSRCFILSDVWLANQNKSISILINKMNNTKTSRLSIKTIKPNNFRVFLKHRSNHHQLSHHPLPNSQTKQTKLSESTLKNDNINTMKQYVRDRIKTENTAASQTQINHKNQIAETAQKSTTNLDEVKTPYEKIKMGSSLTDFKAGLNKSQSNIQSNSKTKIPTLKSLEQKAQNLLLQKLSHCSAYKSEQSQQLQAQIKQLIAQIKQIDNPERSSSAVQFINSKIILFEKLMAQSMAESDIMKKHFLSKIANKGKIRRLKTQGNCNNSKNQQYTYRDNQTCKQVVVNTSSNQQSYRSPQRPAYDIYKYKQEHFNAGRDKQPLPRSSYNREYLIYDNVHESQIIPVGNAIMGRSSSANMFHSSYRDSFGPKRTSRINIRELDACKNKIKNIQIDFSRRNRGSSGMLHYDICRELPSKAKRYDDISRGRVSGKFLLSQSRRQYTRQACNISQASIKHQNLQKLRYQYKNILHA